MRPFEDFASSIAASFNMRPRRHGRELRVCCPVHEADGGHHKPSLAIWGKGDGRYAWKCMTGCDQKSVTAALRARGIQTPPSGPMTTEQQLAAAKANEVRRVEALRRAQDSLQAAKDIEPGSLCEVYLESRGLFIHGRNDFLTILECPDPVFPGRGPALLAVICDITTLQERPIRSTGMQTLSLETSGAPYITPEGRKLRSISGTQKGFGVPFGKAGPHMVVAEGFESAASALEIIDGADFAVATLSASNLPFLAIPSWVRRVTIAADRDKPGIEAATKLKKSLDGMFDCSVVTWPGPDGWDANDELRKRKGIL